MKAPETSADYAKLKALGQAVNDLPADENAVEDAMAAALQAQAGLIDPDEAQDYVHGRLSPERLKAVEHLLRFVPARYRETLQHARQEAATLKPASPPLLDLEPAAAAPARPAPVFRQILKPSPLAAAWAGVVDWVNKELSVLSFKLETQARCATHPEYDPGPRHAYLKATMDGTFKVVVSSKWPEDRGQIICLVNQEEQVLAQALFEGKRMLTATLHAEQDLLRSNQKVHLMMAAELES